MKKRPWLLIVFAFMLLMSAWGVLIYIAVTNQPEQVSLHEEEGDGD